MKQRKRMSVYPVTPLKVFLPVNASVQMREFNYLFEPILAWLGARSAMLQQIEDENPDFRESCHPACNHIRALKGARNDCDDIRQEIEETLNPTTANP
jgi:hypothetical protein